MINRRGGKGNVTKTPRLYIGAEYKQHTYIHLYIPPNQDQGVIMSYHTSTNRTLNSNDNSPKKRARSAYELERVL